MRTRSHCLADVWSQGPCGEKKKGKEGDVKEGQEKREHRRKEKKVQEVMEGKGTR